MADCLHHIASSRLTLRPDHGGTLCHTSEGLSKVTAAADERHLEVVLIDVMYLISWRQDLHE